MYTALVLMCSVEMQTCRGIANTTVYVDQGQCLESLALGIMTAEESGWTVLNYTCINWEKPQLEIIPEES